MENINKACIVSCGVGGWYSNGVRRLEKSLNYVGWAGDTMFWHDYPNHCPKHEGIGQYNFKIYAIFEALKKGYTHIMWCDSSLYAVNDPTQIFDYANDNGLYLFRSGYSLAQTATDRLLDYAGVKDREVLLEVAEYASGCVCFNVLNPTGKEFIERWATMMEFGMFGGNRAYDERDSAHPLFKFSRQDQSAASMALYQMGVSDTGYEKDWVAYWSPNYDPTNVKFFIKGL